MMSCDGKPSAPVVEQELDILLLYFEVCYYKCFDYIIDSSSTSCRNIWYWYWYRNIWYIAIYYVLVLLIVERRTPFSGIPVRESGDAQQV